MTDVFLDWNRNAVKRGKGEEDILHSTNLSVQIYTKDSDGTTDRKENGKKNDSTKYNF